jgi:hypothetical protein
MGRNFRILLGPARGPFGVTQPEPAFIFKEEVLERTNLPTLLTLFNNAV